MNKVLFIVGTYINSIDILKTTYDCIQHIKKFNKYDVLTVSHNLIPEEIQKISNFCFYDERNWFWTGEEMNNQFGFSFTNNNLTITSFTIKNYIPAVYSLTFPLTFAHNLEYDYAVYIDFDNYLIDNKEIEECINILNSENYNCAVYLCDNKDIQMFGTIHIYDLKKYDFKNHTQNLNEIKQKYLEQSEHIAYENFYYNYFIKNNKPFIKGTVKWNEVSNGNKFVIPGILHVNKSTLHKNYYILYILDNKLYFWTQNIKENTVYYNIKTKEIDININVELNIWYNLPLCDVDNDNFLIIKTKDGDINDFYQINLEFINKLNKQTIVIKK